METKKEKRAKNKKRLTLFTVSLVIALGFSAYGIIRLVFAYDVTWTAAHQYTTNDWYYRTRGMSYCTYTWSGGSIQVDQNQGGFYRDGVDGTSILTVKESEVAEYILSNGKSISPGQSVTWTADSRVEFGYSGVISTTAPSISAANDLNNTDFSKVREMVASGNIDRLASDWVDRGAITFLARDSETGERIAYSHKFYGNWEGLGNSGTITIPSYKISVDAIPEAGGSVSGSGTFLPGASTSVSASAATGYTFDGWYEGSSRVSTQESYSFNVTSDRTLTAKFVKNNPEKYTLSTSADPADGGSVGGDSGSYDEGTIVTVDATAKDGYIFSGWYKNGAKVSSSASYSFTLNSNTSLVAKFEIAATNKYYVTFEDEFYIGDTYIGQGNGESYSYDKGYKYSFTTGSTNSYSYGGISGFKCTGVSVSPASSGLSASGLTVSGTISGNATITRNMYKEPAPDIVIPPPEPPAGEETCFVSVIASGNGSVSGGGTYSVGDTVSISASAYYGSYFSSWYSSDCSISSIWSSSASFTIPEGATSITVYGYFYDYGPNSVAYYPNGGTGTAFTEYTDSFDDYTHYVSAPKSNWSAPTGYTDFRIWSTQKNGGTEYNPGDLISYTGSYFTLYARWNPITYIVQFADEDIETRPEPTLSPQQTWVYDSPSPMPAKPFDKQYTVSYNLNKKDTMSTTPKLTTGLKSENTDAVFNKFGWKPYRYNENGVYETAGTILEVGEKRNLTSTDGDRIILFPEWYGDDSLVTLPIAQCDGYDFRGWLEEENRNKDTEEALKNALVAEPYGRKYRPTDNCTLYAMFTPKTYPVELDYQNSNLNYTTTIIMTFDEKGPDVIVPERLHYTFRGYFTEPNGGGVQYYDKDGKGIKEWRIHDGSVNVLYAYWVLDTQIIFHENGCIGYMADVWLDNNATSVTLPKNLYSKHGYTFSKWTTGETGAGTSYTDGQTVTDIPVSSVINLYAQWTQNRITVYFDAGLGSVSETGRAVQYDSAYKYDAANKVNKTLPVPTAPTGYYWEKDSNGNGWFMTDTGKGINDETIVSRTDSHTVVARYKPNTYTVTFDWNFAYEKTGVNTQTGWSGSSKLVTYDSTYGSLPQPTRDGYEFLGWFASEDANGNGTGTEVTGITTVKTAGNHTLYAKWKNLEYTLGFDYNDGYHVDPNN